VRIERGGITERSLVANGCRIAGEVVRSVLFPGVTVARGASVHDSIVMHDTTVGRGSSLERAIVDKQVHVGEGAKVGWGEECVPNRACPEHLSSGIALIGKGAQLPPGLRVGRNARIGAQVSESDFDGDVPSGGVINGPDSMH